MVSTEIPVLVLFGPTASGKTAVAQSLFSTTSPLSPSILSKYVGAVEIISADSMQVYKYMDVGTAKPDQSVRTSLPHHVIDIVTPDIQFGTGDFVQYADKACADIFSRGKLPVIVGGTAFYIHNFMYGLPDTPSSDVNVRKRLTERLKIDGLDFLYQELQRLDPASALRVHKNDAYRILRALEVFEISGKPVGDFTRSLATRKGYRFCSISLSRPREVLADRIAFRVHSMFEHGLEKEFQTLCAKGYTKQDPGMQAIGYREFFLREENLGITSDTIASLIIRNTKKYAKRQETWMRSMRGVHHIHADDIESIFSVIDNFYSDILTEV